MKKNTLPVKFTSSDADGAQKQVTIKTLIDQFQKEKNLSLLIYLKQKLMQKMENFLNILQLHCRRGAPFSRAFYTIDNDSKANSKNEGQQ